MNINLIILENKLMEMESDEFWEWYLIFNFLRVL